jgi:hypothetical protein
MECASASNQVIFPYLSIRSTILPLQVFILVSPAPFKYLILVRGPSVFRWNMEWLPSKHIIERYDLSYWTFLNALGDSVEKLPGEVVDQAPVIQDLSYGIYDGIPKVNTSSSHILGMLVYVQQSFHLIGLIPPASFGTESTQLLRLHQFSWVSSALRDVDCSPTLTVSYCGGRFHTAPLVSLCLHKGIILFSS